MSANPIEENSTPKPTGSLEDLFRHHLGEEAAAPPRPMLWDQIDNSLLVRQNETYRRRLAATRWVAAASLLLATLAGTGWWAHRAADMASTEVATRTTGAGHPATGQATNANPNSSQAPAAVAPTEASGVDNASISLNGDTASPGAAIARNSAARSAQTGRPQAGVGYDSVRAGLENEAASIASSANQSNAASEAASIGATSGSAASSEAVGNNQASVATNTAPVSGNQSQRLNRVENPAVAPAGSAAAATMATTTSGIWGSTAAANAPAMAASFAPSSSVALPGQIDLLVPAPTSLALTTPTALPNGLAALALPAEAEPTVAAASHKWQYGGSYTAGAFNPNINFSREGLGSEYAYNPALGADSPALTEAAATQYRNNLRPGLSQRIALVAKRHLTGNWSLNTGAELSQATAKSASTSAFVGEQLLDLGQFSTGAMRTTSFRYRTAGIPVSLSYSNVEKRGWSLYGRLGGVVSALLGARSEVEGSPEATRTYSIASAGTPYRRVLGSLRGGAGAQYRSTVGNWALTLGPVAELGLMPLNAHPAQSYLAQSRPYSFGVEASVEFGR